MNPYKNIKSRKNYTLLLNSGMFWEFHQELSCNWEIDKTIINPKKYAKTNIRN